MEEKTTFGYKFIFILNLAILLLLSCTLVAEVVFVFIFVSHIFSIAIMERRSYTFGKSVFFFALNWFLVIPYSILVMWFVQAFHGL